MKACQFTFDEKAFLTEFNTQNSEVPIPEAIPDFKDNDYVEEVEKSP